MELPKAVGKPDHRVAFEHSPKRMRVVVADTTIADTLEPGLLFETGYRHITGDAAVYPVAVALSATGTGPRARCARTPRRCSTTCRASPSTPIASARACTENWPHSQARPLL